MAGCILLAPIEERQLLKVTRRFATGARLNRYSKLTDPYAKMS
ncbi:hypothetical protein SAMN05444173_3042 [Opitutus sp. GAS368]|nr:hypothetical protein SAMN05444173_3042 [Opitutus sp. GAS368]